MSDNLRRYRAIRDAFIQGYPGQPTGTVARHLTHPRRAHQWHRGEQEHAAAPNRDASA